VSFVLDNSVALAWCFADEQTPAILGVLDRLTDMGAIAPMLWPLEALNGLLAAERRRRISSPQREVLAGFLRDLPVSLDQHTADEAWEGALALALRWRLTVYDAAYLELAQRRRLPLATVDRDLVAAARAIGIETWGS